MSANRNGLSGCGGDARGGDVARAAPSRASNCKWVATPLPKQELLGPVLRAKEKPPRLLELTMTVQQYLRVQSYQRKNWGLRDLIEDQVLLKASTSPSSIGMLMSMVGVPKVWAAVDAKRGVAKGSSETALEAITQRRNRIAHSGDRQGRGRALITVGEVERDLACLVDVVGALDHVTGQGAAAKSPSPRRT